MLEHVYLIPLLPLVVFTAIIFGGRFVPPRASAFLSILTMAWCFIQSLAIFIGLYRHTLVAGEGWIRAEWYAGEYLEKTWSWFQTGLFQFEFGLLIDGLSSVMLVVVTLVSLLVQIFSMEYQTDVDENHERQPKPYFSRYYAFISLFSAAMLLLVVGNNFFQFFIGWELVGVCSYFLIGFEFHRPEAADAGRKAFITTKLGDMGFYIALLLIFTAIGTFNFVLIEREHVGAGLVSPWMATTICLLLFLGAVGKSAQVPLHVWLPDAMEGPTPVSALIHAATMVAAGVYLVARVFFLFELSPLSLQTVAWFGGITAIFAASMALVTADIKRVLAFSTVSQLGYMFMALGAGSITAGMFHLTTHAAFKALMFLASGAVIHAVHTNDMWKMGGLSRKMPLTFIFFAIGWLAIAGFPGLSGFYSKEEVLASLYGSDMHFLFWLGLVTAAMTAFYMTRLIVLTFLGDARDTHRFSQAHDPGPAMWVPLLVLAIPSLAVGALLVHIWPFTSWIPSEDVHHVTGLGLMSFVAFISGTGLAISMYLKKIPNPETLAHRFSRAHQLVNSRYYIDEAYLWMIQRFVTAPSVMLAKFDDQVVDRIFIDGWARLCEKIAVFKMRFDDLIVDGIFINGWGKLSVQMGTTLRKLQTGFVQWYLLVVAVGLAVISVWIIRIN